MLTEANRAYLRDLAKELKYLSSTPRYTAIVRKYKTINSLGHVDEPPIMVYPPQRAIDEYMRGLEFRIEEEPYRSLERDWQWKLHKSRMLPDDTPITGVVYTGFHSHVTDWMDGYKTVRIDANLKASCFEPCIVDRADARKMRPPELTVDWEKTDESHGKVEDLAGDILRVVKGHPFNMTCGWGESMIDQFVEIRGLQQSYYDFVDAPAFVHEVMDFMTEGKLRLLDQYRANHLLVLNNCDVPIGSSSLGYCDELPGKDFDGTSVREKDLWGFAQAQELSEVSPAMLEEFVLPYQARIINRFGLSTYGCCEAMEHKIDVVARHIRNLRMISISPFTDHSIAGPICRNRFVYAWKPQPAFVTHFNEAAIRQEMHRAMEFAGDCAMTISLEDVYTFGGDITRFNWWLEIARDETGRRDGAHRGGG